MKLFLSSPFSDVSEAFPEFEKNVKGKTVTFIPAASKVEEYTGYVDEGKQELEAMGLTVDELDVSTANHDEISGKLKANDLIYVTGSNTFYLLQELKRIGNHSKRKYRTNRGRYFILLRNLHRNRRSHS